MSGIFAAGWQQRWKESSWKEEEGARGKWEHSAGEWFGHEEDDKGIRTTEDYRFYTLWSEFPEFTNKGKDLVLQVWIAKLSFGSCSARPSEECMLSPTPPPPLSLLGHSFHVPESLLCKACSPRLRVMKSICGLLLTKPCGLLLLQFSVKHAQKIDCGGGYIKLLPAGR